MLALVCVWGPVDQLSVMLSAAQAIASGAVILIWLLAPERVGKYAAELLFGFTAAHLLVRLVR